MRVIPSLWLTRQTRPGAGVAMLALLVVSLVGGWLAPRAARADGDSGAWRANKGRIFVSDTEFGQGYASDGAMVKAMKKQSKTAVANSGDGAWTLNFMVFLKEAPGAEKVNIVYYDISAKPREQVNYSEVGVKPDQKIIQLNGVAISKDLGFVKGHKYDVLATRLIGGKEKVYARTTVKLK
ncbi:MAG TPA: hypothetical protein VFH68_01935 [Polyangia bacterium]|nr:hypothetical protein [Polyangia bacterium]